MASADLSAVRAIERRAFSSPWKEETFRSLLTRSGVEAWVAEDPEDGVVGYVILWRVLDEGELANIAVKEGRRGQGIGSLLLDRILEVAAARGVRRVCLEVRVSNAGAAKLYEARGFQEVAVRRNYYRNPVEDARVMDLRLEEPDAES